MENRDRAMQLELKNRGKEEILEAVSLFLDREERGQMRLEKAGEAFSLWTEPEPICS